MDECVDWRGFWLFGRGWGGGLVVDYLLERPVCRSVCLSVCTLGDVWQPHHRMRQIGGYFGRGGGMYVYEEIGTPYMMMGNECR